MQVGLGTAGLTSGYQRTNVTAVGVSAVVTTGGYMVVGVVSVPVDVPLPVAWPSEGIVPRIAARDEDRLAKGYQAMALENSRLAEESFGIALEGWPMWEE